MSALRVPGPDGRTILRIIDDGASPSRASKGIRGGIGNPVVFGAFVVGESEASRNRRQSAEHKARRLYAGEDLTPEEREWRRREYLREWQRERRAQGLRSNGHPPKDAA